MLRHLFKSRIALGAPLALALLAQLLTPPPLHAQDASQATTPDSPGSPAGTNVVDQVAALKLDLTNAFAAVQKIVNQPVQAYRRTSDMQVSIFRPGWFHPGAPRPDFNHVDIRQTREEDWGKLTQWVTSDLNPGVVFRTADLEYNPMTKYFYTNRSLPKRRLTEAEMVEINRLYRIIGHSEDEILRLEMPAETAAARTAAQTEAEETVPGQKLEGLRKIPQKTRVLYGSIAIGALVLVVLALQAFRKRSA